MLSERTDQRADAPGSAPAREPRQDAATAGEPGSAWASMLFGPREIERLVDRLSVALQTQTQLVRELDESRAQLAAHQCEVEEARARAEAARRKAERSAETLSTFLHALGHDLRAPFTSIGAGLELLALEAHSTDAAARADRLASLARTCAHGLSMVDDLFELVRSDAGQWRIDLRDHRLDDLVRDALALVAPRAAAKGLALRVEWSEKVDRDLRLRTDGTRVRQALANILGNAVKFSDSGAIVLQIEIDSGVGAPEWLRLSVIDAGPGFDPADLPAVFESFRQSLRTGRHAHEGAGLGLAIVARCAALLGGTATASNNGLDADGTGMGTGTGACVTLRLPLERVARGAPPLGERPPGAPPPGLHAPDLASHPGPARVSKPVAPPETAPTDAPPAAALRVLVVEDSPESRRLAEHHFARAGCVVRSVDTVAAARAALADAACGPAPFDLVVIDDELPDGRGTELLGAPRLPPVVLSSARVEIPAMRLRGLAGTLPKPISRESVVALVRAFEACSGPRADGRDERRGGDGNAERVGDRAVEREGDGVGARSGDRKADRKGDRKGNPTETRRAA